MTLSCERVVRLLHELPGPEIDGDAGHAALAHAAACPPCGETLRELRRTMERVGELAQEPLPANFSSELRERLLRVETPRPTLGDRLRALVSLRPITATLLAASVASMLTLAVTRQVSLRRATQAELSHRVPLAKAALVRIDFVAAAAQGDVQFEILLPEGLRFVSTGKELPERSIRWTGPLREGSNPIPVVIKGTKKGTYQVVAHAQGATFDVVHEVTIEVTS
jgi:hypothetical protein